MCLAFVFVAAVSCGSRAAEAGKVNAGELADDFRQITSEEVPAAQKMLKDYYLKLLKIQKPFEDEEAERKLLTPYMQGDVVRFGNEYGYNLIIASNDFGYVASTLKVESLGNGWFRIGGSIDTFQGPEYMNNYAKVVKAGEDFKVAYIYPFGTENMMPRCSDSIFYYSLPETDIDDNDAESFVAGFVERYTNIYATITADVERETAALRAERLTPQVIASFDAERKRQADVFGALGYDLLIDGFYFDRWMKRGVKVEKVAEDCFRVRYGVRTVEMKTIYDPQHGKFMINDLKVLP